MKDPEIQKELLEKYLQNTCSPQEVQQLLEYFLRGDDAERQLLELMQQQLETPAPDEEQDPAVRAKLQQALVHIRAGIMAEAPRTQVRMRRWMYAAAALLIAAMATIFYFIGTGSKDQSPAGVSTEIQAGYNQATLTLADGRKIDLDSTQNGIIVNDSIKYADGTILPRAGTSVKHGDVIKNLQLSTPRGGQYQIILSDGTKVWLNAASTLTYPSKFTGDSRIVELTGEAYFEVAKSKTLPKAMQGGEIVDPFIVRTKEQSITVLGTEFNVSAYGNEESIKTTLVSGAVQVSPLIMASGNPLRLLPGEQAVFEKGQLRKSKIDVDIATSWKSGLFDFTGKKLPEVMHELERWYNISVSYEGSIPQNTYYGNIYRHYSLDKVLKIFENVQIKFRMEEGNRLIISQKN